MKVTNHGGLELVEKIKQKRNSICNIDHHVLIYLSSLLLKKHKSMLN